MREIVLDRLAARDDDGRRDQLQRIGKRSEILPHVRRQRRVRRRDLAVDDGKHAVTAIGFLAPDAVEEHGISPVPRILREMHRKLNGTENPWVCCMKTRVA